MLAAGGISPRHDLGESNDMPNETYDTVKLEQIKSKTVTRIYGRPLEDNDQLGLTDRTRDDSRFPIHWCFCVQDSPSSPCLCMPHIVWLGHPDVVTYGKTDQKDHAGEALYFFDLKNDATLLLERLQPISTGTAKRLAGLSPADAATLLDASTTPAGVPFGVAENPVVVVLEGIAAAMAIIKGLNDAGVFDAIDWQGFVHGQH
jgi:hypothetical protein